MSEGNEKRRASRIAVHLPTVIESIGQPAMALPPSLEAVYERVAPADAGGDVRRPGTVRDLSTNGAFLACDPLPLLSRVAFAFELEGFGGVEVIGWVLWRRGEECEIPGPGDAPVSLPAGVGVLFEAIPLDARIVIHRLVHHATEA